MKRLHTWQADYAAFLSARAKAPYAWGVNDCCTFSADGIKAITGVDIAEEFRGYADEAGAYAAIERVCGGSSAADAVAWCANKFELAELPTVLLAQRGDLLLVQNAGALIAGLVSMHGKAACVTERGLFSFPIRSAVKAFRV